MRRRERRSVVAVERDRAVRARARHARLARPRRRRGSSSWSRRRGALLPRPFSLCLAPRGELAFLVDPVGPGTRAIAALEPGDQVAVFGPLGNGFRLDVRRPVLVGGGIGVAPLPYLSEALERPPAVLGFRDEHHAEAAALVPRAEVVIDPVLVTDAIPPGRDVLACGPEPMLEAVRALAPDAQLAWEAPDGVRPRRLPRLRRGARRAARAALRRRPGAVLLLNASGCLDALDRAGDALRSSTRS